MTTSPGRVVQLAWLGLFASAASAEPTIDGVAAADEWDEARQEALAGGRMLMTLRVKDDLYIALRGTATGFPTVCIGDGTRVDILHASAALGTVSYVKQDGDWQRGAPFSWRVRDRSSDNDPAQLQREREAFFNDELWLANANAKGEGLREFRIALTPHRRRLALVYLDTASMQQSVWPTEITDGCADPDLVRGDAPERLQFTPERWHAID